MTSPAEVDGVRARSEERPKTAEELAQRLRDAAAAGQAVVPIGGGRALGIGNPPERFDVALHTTGLDRIVEHSQSDLVVTAEAGVTVEALNELLGKAGQFLPLDPFGGPGHTVGGVLAAGLSGPLRLRFGSARDYLIGLRVALPDGSLASSGGRVVKNVSGYDMNKLHHGAFGSLGVIVTASFKVFPQSLEERSLEARGLDAAEAWRHANAALMLPVQPMAVVLERRSGAWSARARLSGTRATVDRLSALLGWPPAEVDWSALSSRRAATWARLSVRPGSLPEVVGGLPESGDLLVLPGVGAAHWFEAGPPDAIRAARTAAEAAGGSLTLMAASPELKRELDAWGTPPPTLEVMRRLKDAFDGGRVLSPGRFLV